MLTSTRTPQNSNKHHSPSKMNGHCNNEGSSPPTQTQLAEVKVGVAKGGETDNHFRLQSFTYYFYLPIVSSANHMSMGGYSMMQPNESRRSKLQRMAKQEEEDLQRWKEEHRAGPVNLPPERLGGALSMEEARSNQAMRQRQAKYQPKLKREEHAKKQKEAEEEEIKKMKTVQREKVRLVSTV
ncbi:epithelial-stromal interaction protein 1-like isoform X1 [Polypterus senegalus]|uniref:epithelial-stromal interaction protein 1-like isoform X1 n=1 Tax=Polypterus senegalus TaxID=55291 RepID=UPI001962A115|nr:epithelial-stromal interaction protein 1-like isoform X1 [Polypterus senegalus]